MSVEARRGCGYRKVGGTYLMGEGESRGCGRLPLPLGICPTCSGGVKQTRGWTWVDPVKLFAAHPCPGHPTLTTHALDCVTCPLGPDAMFAIGRAGLLWIGTGFYKTPRDFLQEADQMGICRRITAVPKGFKIGETWVLLAHPKAIETTTFVKVQRLPPLDGEPEQSTLPDMPVVTLSPGVFRIFKPTAIEKLVTDTQAKDEEAMEKLRAKGITPVAVPDDDKDHQGTVYDKDDEES